MKENTYQDEWDKLLEQGYGVYKRKGEWKIQVFINGKEKHMKLTDELYKKLLDTSEV